MASGDDNNGESGGNDDDKPTIQRDARRGGKSIRASGKKGGKGKVLNAIAAAAGMGEDAAAAAVAAAESTTTATSSTPENVDPENSSPPSAAAATASAAVAFTASSDSMGELECNEAVLKDNGDEEYFSDDDEECRRARLLESLSENERYRFECFRRCGFDPGAVSAFVAKTLVEESNERYGARAGTVLALGGTLAASKSTGGGIGGAKCQIQVAGTIGSTSVSSEGRAGSKKFPKRRQRQLLPRQGSKRRRAALDRPPPYYHLGTDITDVDGNANSNGTLPVSAVPPLEDLVVPQAASEIVAVVSALVKCYAQRLVLAAKRVADVDAEGGEVEDQPQERQPQPRPIQSRHLLEAFRHRVDAGLDPGFWMDCSARGEYSGFGGASATATKIAAAAVGATDLNREAYLATLAVQDAYEGEDTGSSEGEGGEGEKNGLRVTHRTWGHREGGITVSMNGASPLSSIP